AGLALSHKAIAEMQTGEGKTFVAALPATLFSLSGGGAHVMTVNAYLAQRDFELLSPLYSLLGVSVGSLQADAQPDEKEAAYACDITYGPGYEFGFDYLRDQTALLSRRKCALGESYLRSLRGEQLPPQRTLQRKHAFAIVDEIDSILLDEATSPLVLAEGGRRMANNAGVYIKAMRTADRLRVSHDYVVDAADQFVRLTQQGQEKIYEDTEEIPAGGLQRPWSAYIEQALRAAVLLNRDADYVVDDDEILLVDKATGRIFADRTLRQGLHQAIEAKEQVPITAEQQPLARISRQRYFRLYQGLCGMTGTATGNEREFWTFYRIPVIRIPLARPSRRRTLPMRSFADEAAKMAAIANDVRRINEAGQPVLVGTRTIETSRRLAQQFDELGISYQLLNGMQDGEEANIIARAGQEGAVTLATNMAGRGTDIKLGPRVDARGGLHVVVSEPQESTRVDRQLIGRCARQSDPGSFQCFISADDQLITEHAPALSSQLKQLADEGGEIDSDFSQEIFKLQRKVERLSYLRRRQLFAHDDWLEDVLSRLANDG
ncbi:MAG: preprotein translocase subunit SecA, partial [Thermoguttaceae bacterium]